MAESKTLIIPRIRDTTDGGRDIISVAGMPFYQSTGQNSLYPGTWFPFWGILEKTDYFARGYYMKSSRTELPMDIINAINTHFPSAMGAANGHQLKLRFWRLPCLLISAKLGGGLWLTEPGKAFLSYLETEYARTLAKIPALQLAPRSFETQVPEAINRWLCEATQLSTATILKKSFPRSIDGFEFETAKTPLERIPSRRHRQPQLQQKATKKAPLQLTMHAMVGLSVLVMVGVLIPFMTWYAIGLLALNVVCSAYLFQKLNQAKQTIQTLQFYQSQPATTNNSGLQSALLASETPAFRFSQSQRPPAAKKSKRPASRRYKPIVAH